MERISKLAKIIVNHSLKVKENDKVLITFQGMDSMPLVKEIMKEVIKAKGVVDYDYQDQALNNYIRENLSDGIIECKTRKVKIRYWKRK